MKEGLSNGVFAKMKFPAYKFEEFPKHVPLKETTPKGKRKFAIVNNKREEIALHAEGKVLMRQADPLKDENLQLEQAINTKNAQIEDLKRQLAEAKGRAIVEGPKAAAPVVDSAAKAKA